MSERFFGVDFGKGKDVSIVTIVKGSDGSVSLEDARREVLADFTAEASLVPGHLKVSCPFGGCCKSPSRRDASKPKKTWVCGSNFSHNERMDCCVSYCRLDRGLRDGVSGNRRFPK